MSILMISYDLRTPGRNYQDLYAAIKAVDHCHALESVWLIDVNQTSIQVRDSLKALADANDGILVIEFAPQAGWAYSNLLPGAGEWIKRKRP